MGKFTRMWGRLYERIKWDIFEYAAELGFTGPINQPGGLSWQQADFLQAIQIATHGFPSRRYPHVTSRATANLGEKWLACKSGQGPGKTTASTIGGSWRTLQEPGALTMVSAPTMAQCRDVWNTELRRTLEKANPLLRDVINPTRSRVVFKGNPDWTINFCTSTKTESSQGRHHPKMTWINEEASGIPRALCVQVEGTLSNLEDEFGGDEMNGMFINIGNPNTRDCYFFDCFNQDAHHWWTYTMNAEETPAYIVSPERNRRLAKKYGRNSDVYRVRVLGEFPWANPNCVISSEDLMACTRTDPNECMRYGRYENGRLRLAKQIGVDFARYGNDESTVFARVGHAIVHWKTFQKVDPNVVAAYALRLRVQLGWSEKETWYVCDAGGMGQGVMATFLATNANVVEFHNGGKSSQADYFDKITEAMFELGRKVANRSIYIPNDNRLIQQLSTRQYYMDDSRGKAKLRVESKEKYLERMRKEAGSVETVTSPDRADGLLYCFYDQVEAVGRIAQRSA